MELSELGSDGKSEKSGPGTGGAAIVVLVLASVAYAATGSVVTTVSVFVGAVLAVLLFDRLYERYVLWLRENTVGRGATPRIGRSARPSGPSRRRRTPRRGR